MQKGLVEKAPFSVVNNSTTEKRGGSIQLFPYLLWILQEVVCSLWNTFLSKCSVIHGPKCAHNCELALTPISHPPGAALANVAAAAFWPLPDFPVIS